jgi:hypothetical protein
MPHAIGQTLPLSRLWRFLSETFSLGRTTSPMRIQRRLLLADVATARGIASPSPSWRAVFLKAFAHVSAANPLLRRCFLSWPWPRIYEHPETVAVLPVERNAEIEFVRLKRPESLRLSEIDDALASPATPPPTGLAMQLGTACSGRFRARRFGTLSLSAVSLHPPSILIPRLHHGPVSNHGEVDVCLEYDPRVLDGVEAARILTALEDSLHERILIELRYLESAEAA